MDCSWFRGVGVVLVTTGGAAAYPKCEGFSQLAIQMKDIQIYTCNRKDCNSQFAPDGGVKVRNGLR